MPLKIPTYNELITRACQTLNNEVEGLDAFEPNSVAKVFAKIMAGMNISLYQYLENISKNMFVFSCDEETLLLKGEEYGLYPYPAIFATGEVIFNGNVDFTLPKNTIIKNKDGYKYKLLEEAKADDKGILNCKVKSLLAGKKYNMNKDEFVFLENSKVGIETKGKVKGIYDGNDRENINDFRNRFLTFLREPAGTGDKNFYINAAKKFSNVKDVWCFPRMKGASTVGIMFTTKSDENNNIPTKRELKKLQEYIQDLAPAGTIIYTCAPDIKRIDIKITDLIPNTSNMKETIKTSLSAFIPNYKPSDIIYVSQIDNVISNIAGQINHKLLLPANNITLNEFEIPVLGNVEYV